MSVPYNKMVKAELIATLKRQDVEVAALRSENAQLAADVARSKRGVVASRNATSRAPKGDYSFRREAARRYCAEFRVRSVDAETLDHFISAIAIP